MKDKDLQRGFFLLFSFVALFVVILIINQYATQYVAKSFGYDAGLGNLILGNWYQPFAWIKWSYLYANSNKIFFKILFIKIGLAHLVAFFIFAAAKLLYYRRAKSYDDVHGTAHFATADEIKKMNIIEQKQGVYIGAWQEPKSNYQKYLKHDGPEHILAFAPTRTGKGVGLVIPTLLAWEGSCVILDIKGENWELTSGYRQEIGNNVLRFDPVAEKGGVGYNPLEEIRLNSIYTVSDVQNIASIIIDPDGKGLEDHWAKTGYALLTTMILHLVYKAQNEGFVPNLSQLRGLINDPEKDSVKDVLAEWIEYKHYKDEMGELITDPVVAVGAKEAMNKPDNELGSVVSTVVSNLSLYDDPVVKKNISQSDFKIKDLMGYADKKNSPVSLYLVIKPSDMNRLRPLVRIILNQILTILVGDMKFEGGQQKVEYANRLLLMLDEFTSLGRLPLFETALAYMAGYGIKAYIIVQDLTQLYKAYSKDEAIISNSHVRIAYAPNKVETAELLSKMSGQTTVVKTVRTTSGGRGSVVLGHVSENYQEVQRPLLTIDECMQLPPDDMLIFIAGQPTVYGKKIKYYLDPVFSKRSKIAAPKQSDSLRNKNYEQVS